MSKLMLNPEFNLYERNGKSFCSSRQIAEELNKRHSDVLRDIEVGIENLNKADERKFALINFLASTYKDERNRRQPEFLLPKDGFVYVTMGYSGNKATRFKVAYINRFNEMESFIKNLFEAKSDFPEFTRAIMDAHEEPKNYHFSGELDMINRIVVGMTASQFRKTHNLGNISSIRPYLTPQQAEAVKTLQRIDIGLILAVPDFQQRKQILTGQFNRKSKMAEIV